MRPLCCWQPAKIFEPVSGIAIDQVEKVRASRNVICILTGVTPTVAMVTIMAANTAYANIVRPAFRATFLRSVILL